jgi:hypothetical protein
MNVSRETIMTALFKLLQGVTFAPTSDGATAFLTTSRKLKLWSDVPQQPALYMAEHAENLAYQSENLPSKTTIDVDVYVYFKPSPTSDDDTAGSIYLNNILDGIDAAIAPDVVTNRQTLGGLVSHCRIDGKVLKDPGDIDGQGLAVIPIKILVP